MPIQCWQWLTCGRLLPAFSATLYIIFSWAVASYQFVTFGKKKKKERNCLFLVPKINFTSSYYKATFTSSRHGRLRRHKSCHAVRDYKAQILWNSGHWHLSAFFSQLHISGAPGIPVDLLLPCTSGDERTKRPLWSHKQIWGSSPKGNPVASPIYLKLL